MIVEPPIADPLSPRVLVRAAILGFFIGVQLLDGALTYMRVDLREVAAEQAPLLAWSMGHFGVGATLAGAKVLAVACGVVLLGRLLRGDLLSSVTTTCMSRACRARQ